MTLAIAIVAGVGMDALVGSGPKVRGVDGDRRWLRL